MTNSYSSYGYLYCSYNLLLTVTTYSLLLATYYLLLTTTCYLLLAPYYLLFTTTYYYLLLLTTTYYYLLLLTTTYYYLLLLTTTYYYLLLLTTTYYYLLLLTTTYCYFLLLTTTYYCLLLLTTTYYYLLLLTTTYYDLLLLATTYGSHASSCAKLYTARSTASSPNKVSNIGNHPCARKKLSHLNPSLTRPSKSGTPFNPQPWQGSTVIPIRPRTTTRYTAPCTEALSHEDREHKTKPSKSLTFAHVGSKKASNGIKF